MFSGLKVSSFQERFATLFDESHKTTTALSKELHVSYQTISAWKIGTRSPKLPTVMAIAEYFGVKFEWLMGYDVEKEDTRVREIPIVVPDSDRFVKLIRYMPHEDYIMVMHAFEKADKKMREEEGKNVLL